MIEAYIKDKVSSIMGRMPNKNITSEEKNRKIRDIANIITNEIDIATEAYKKHICTYVHRVLKDKM